MLNLEVLIKTKELVTVKKRTFVCLALFELHLAMRNYNQHLAPLSDVWKQNYESMNQENSLQIQQQ